MASRAVYSAVLRILAPAIWLWMWRRAKRAGGSWSILGRARFGRYDADSPLRRPVWVHAVSLDETRAAYILPIMRQILGMHND